LNALPARGLRRAAFLLFTLALIVATLWPRLKLPGPENTDKVTHVLAFGLWTLLLVLASYTGPLGSRRNLLGSALIAPIFAGADELAQLLPGVHRTCAWDDYAANLIGIAIGLGAGLALGLGRGKIASPARTPGPEPSRG
jgi:hypothetical protein